MIYMRACTNFTDIFAEASLSERIRISWRQRVLKPGCVFWYGHSISFFMVLRTTFQVDGDNHSWFKLQDWLIGNLPTQKYHRLNPEKYQGQTLSQEINDAQEQETLKPCATPLCAEKWTKRPTGPLEIYREKERESSTF